MALKARNSLGRNVTVSTCKTEVVFSKLQKNGSPSRANMFTLFEDCIFFPETHSPFKNGLWNGE
jgi:hypothetical protein